MIPSPSPTISLAKAAFSEERQRDGVQVPVILKLYLSNAMNALVKEEKPAPKKGETPNSCEFRATFFSFFGALSR